MLSKRKVMLAAGAAILAALAGGRAARADDYNWAHGDNGSKPFDAVRGGTDSDKQPLYFCRVYYINGFQPGKLNPNLQTCNFGYGGMELTSTVYQVLAPKWVSERDGVVPSYSFEAGTDTDGAPLYFCRASYQGGLQPGKLKKGPAAISVLADRKFCSLFTKCFGTIYRSSATRIQAIFRQ